ncbi:hypothetical protein PG608_02675 [Riemerella anatipestifer]|uniref:hypothetical protein n=1 Tax=Riemerella anatipestifer TaxID=34085 RepID=UPI000AE29E56|nr:hypothetical protein [Riemerella anatipestifer]MCU7567178.1 hypothetical protein [Riemerella anatipestifer]MDY3432027.1 hypothetical protein [Riemerella anatipestifer]MDY3438758.1 hypothetical protein [Riemerella anatipestifer]MDY3518116.1 hypothetical protein [Riemerella anatipestifer]MDY3543102.1 hypothetical protein [Riemerella anatipestifer]
MFCLTTWSFLLGAFSVQKGSLCCLSVLAFPLVLCVLRGERHFLGLEVRCEILELSITSTLKSNIQYLTLNIQNLTSEIQYLKSKP